MFAVRLCVSCIHVCVAKAMLQSREGLHKFDERLVGIIMVELDIVYGF